MRIRSSALVNPAENRPTGLTPTGSAVLDGIRFAAALVVCYGHLSAPQFSTGWRTRLDWAGDAVAVFFVLSGFMMRLITTTKVTGARDYCIDRVSRMYSVVLPALAFTVFVSLVDLLHRNNPPLSMFVAGLPKLIGVTLADLSFTSQFLGLNIGNPINPVFWSLSYECSYYLLFGLIIFWRGRKSWVALAIVCLVLGLPIMLLFPVWLTGCVAHDVYQRARYHRSAWLASSLVLGISGAIMLFARPLLRNVATHLRGSSIVLSLQHLHALLEARHLHLFQRAGPTFYMVGIPFAIVMVWLLLMADASQHVTGWRGSRWIRQVAEGTFSIYLMHFACLFLFAEFVPYAKSNAAIKWVLFAGVVLLCVVLSIPMERFKRFLRRRLLSSARVPVEQATTMSGD